MLNKEERMRKVAVFTFMGDRMCFAHALLNAIEMKESGIEVKLILEGKSVALLEDFIEEKNPLFQKTITMGIMDGVCRACSDQMGVLSYNEQSGIQLLDELKGHPSMARYIDEGFEIITL